VSADPTGLVARLRKLDCCAVSDAIDRLGLDSGVVTGLLQQGSGASRIAGRAITLKLGVGTPKAGPPKRLGATAVEIGGPDDVIVIEQRSGVEAGSWGQNWRRAETDRWASVPYVMSAPPPGTGMGVVSVVFQ